MHPRSVFVGVPLHELIQQSERAIGIVTIEESHLDRDQVRVVDTSRPRARARRQHLGIASKARRGTNEEACGVDVSNVLRKSSKQRECLMVRVSARREHPFRGIVIARFAAS
ncbi:MAG: hypothetical protein HYV09_35040 [Deltaproteobacteria bacterium]|nr:hypothetical protein [Deltaproteobacteria bacterium]